MRRLLPVFILLVGLAGGAALVMSKPEREPLSVEERAWIVAVQAVVPQRRHPHLTLYGRVDSPRVARLSAAIAADVRAVNALEGGRVHAGDALVELDGREAALVVAEREADLADVEAQIEHERRVHEKDRASLGHEEKLLELARREVKRAEDLAQRNVGSRSSLDKARQSEEQYAMAVDTRRLAIAEHASRLAQLEARRARAAALRDRAALDVERTRISAPFDGRITEVSVSPGDRVRPGDPLLGLYDLSHVEIRSQVPVRHLARVRATLDEGAVLRASATVDGKRIEAVLDRLTARVTRGAGGADALFVVEDGSDGLQLGRTVELVLELPAVEGVVAVPYEAVYGNGRIYRLEDGRMRGIDVERMGELRSATGESLALVRSPELASGDQVIVTQLPNATDGLRVTVH